MSEPRPTGYIDSKGRILFVSDGISRGKSFCTFYRSDSGSLKRLKSKHLPIRDSRAAAEADLRLWMEGEPFASITAEEGETR